jgi:hypothetical protein
MSFKLGDYVVVTPDKSESCLKKGSFFYRNCLPFCEKGILIKKMAPESYDDYWWTVYVSEKRGTINYPETMLRNLKDYEKD